MIKIDDEIDLSIQDVMLAQDVKRWTIVRTIKDQSLAEHSFNVTMIAIAICTKLGMDDTNVIKYALTHDLAEILTGDVPTPAKRRLGVTRKFAGKHYYDCSSVEIQVVMLADQIEAITFLIDNQVGRHSHSVVDYLTDRYKERCGLFGATLPELVKAANEVVAELQSGIYEAEKRDE